jgi:hypothetical protein
MKRKGIFLFPGFAVIVAKLRRVEVSLAIEQV